jgi:hypothetical protein
MHRGKRPLVRSPRAVGNHRCSPVSPDQPPFAWALPGAIYLPCGVWPGEVPVVIGRATGLSGRSGTRSAVGRGGSPVLGGHLRPAAGLRVLCPRAISLGRCLHCRAVAALDFGRDVPAARLDHLRRDLLKRAVQPRAEVSLDLKPVVPDAPRAKALHLDVVLERLTQGRAGAPSALWIAPNSSCLWASCAAGLRVIRVLGLTMEFHARGHPLTSINVPIICSPGSPLTYHVWLLSTPWHYDTAREFEFAVPSRSVVAKAPSLYVLAPAVIVDPHGDGDAFDKQTAPCLGPRLTRTRHCRGSRSVSDLLSLKAS